MGLIEVRNLTVDLRVQDEMRTVLRDVSLEINRGEAVGLVGESGSGKSMTVRAIGRLLPDGAQVSGDIQFDGHDLLHASRRQLDADRLRIAMIFQDPRSYINPVRRVGDHVTEQIRAHHKSARSEATQAAIALLSQVGIARGEEIMNSFPHQLSGGMLQRVMIAGALIGDPDLILADEPTTALDVTTQAEVMAILDEQRRRRDLALLFITHDLDLAAAVCDRTAVMYAGELVETQPSAELHSKPRHPYSAALAAARPSVRQVRHRLNAIPGQPLSAFEAPTGCSFQARCSYAADACAERPPLIPTDTGSVRCIRANELRERLGDDLSHA